MTDVMLPQVAPPQAVVKPDRAMAKSAESPRNSESNQDFSKTLKDSMRAEKGDEAKTGDKPKATDPADAPPSESATADSADGKELPATGNTEDGLIAALVNETPTETSPALQQDGVGNVPKTETGDDAAPETATPPLALPITITTPEKASGPALAEAASARPAVSNATPQPALPAPAQSAVAQAVRDAITERDAAAASQQTQQRIGAEVKIMAAVQHQVSGFEALLERVAPQQQTPSTSALPQGLQGMLAQDTSAATARPVLPTTTLETPFRQPGWDQALSERVLWAASQKLQSAEIRLNPPQLGPIEVRVQMHQDQTQVSFTAQHAVVRDALEAAMPRLRDMLNASGFNLVDVNVSQHSFAEQQRHAQGFEAPTRRGRGDDNAMTVAGTPPLQFSRVEEMPRSGIDLFA